MTTQITTQGSITVNPPPNSVGAQQISAYLLIMDPNGVTYSSQSAYIPSLMPGASASPSTTTQVTFNVPGTWTAQGALFYSYVISGTTYTSACYSSYATWNVP